jgi:RNA-directed DNA polymerase
MNGARQQTAGSADEATQGGEAQRDFTWVEASIWTERMLSALGNGVKGGKWFWIRCSRPRRSRRPG